MTLWDLGWPCDKLGFTSGVSRALDCRIVSRPWARCHTSLLYTGRLSVYSRCFRLNNLIILATMTRSFCFFWCRLKYFTMSFMVFPTCQFIMKYAQYNPHRFSLALTICESWALFFVSSWCDNLIRVFLHDVMFSFILFRRNINYLLPRLLNIGNQIYYLEISTVMMYMPICLNISIQRLTCTS